MCRYLLLPVHQHDQPSMIERLSANCQRSGCCSYGLYHIGKPMYYVTLHVISHMSVSSFSTWMPSEIGQRMWQQLYSVNGINTTTYSAYYAFWVTVSQMGVGILFPCHERFTLITGYRVHFGSGFINNIIPSQGPDQSNLRSRQSFMLLYGKPVIVWDWLW